MAHGFSISHWREHFMQLAGKTLEAVKQKPVRKKNRLGQRARKQQALMAGRPATVRPLRPAFGLCSESIRQHLPQSCLAWVGFIYIIS